MEYLRHINITATISKGLIYMEKNNRQHTKGQASVAFVILLPVVVGLLSFALCVLLLPFPMLRYSDPAALVGASCIVTVAITAFFSAFTAKRVSGGHFLLCALVCALVIAGILFGCGVIFGNGEGFAFTAVMSAAALIFSLFGAKIGAERLGSGRRRKRR